MTKTAFVAISRVDDKGEQLKLWEDAKKGRLTTRQIAAKKKTGKPISPRSKTDRLLLIGSELSIELKQLKQNDIVDNAALVSRLNEIRAQIDAILRNK